MIAAALGELPALPLHTAGKYVAGAYIALFAIVLVYVAIMAIRLSRIEGELSELLSESRRAEQDEPREPARAYAATGRQPSRGAGE